ncbi:MAG: T9SS type A sorting domain-containing protein [Bacteroidetes bacterium]|nr:T9SS type A sorting domain-containing protein [Bacteroidota bacterium]
MDYTFVDSKPSKGINYYRLEQIDYNGDYEYSPIRYVIFNSSISSQEISVYPNPANDRINISGLEGDEVIRIYDYTGKLVYQSEKQQIQDSILIAQFSSGVYYISIIKADGTTASFRIVKE